MVSGDLSVIVVNFNTRKFLEKCLHNLQSLAVPLEVVVVDNASSDGSVEMVRTNFPSVTLIALEENKGLAFGYNRGFKVSSGRFLLLLGSDAFPDRKAVLGMIEFMEKNREVGIATPCLVLASGELDKDAHRGFPTILNSLSHFACLDRLFRGSKVFDGYFLGYKDFSVPQEIDLCIAHFMMARRETFVEVGGFDDVFFVYGEDVDFCYRVKNHGWKVMYLPQWTVTHYKGVSVGIRKETKDLSQASRETKLRMAYESTRAMALFYDKHYTGRYPKVLTALALSFIRVKGKVREILIRLFY